MNSKDKGNIGEAVVLSKFVELGVQISIPFGDNARYDLIADFNGKLQRIQVKYCDSINENNAIVCPCSSSLNHTTNKTRTTYESEVDYFAFYLKPTGEVLLVSMKELEGKKSILFRWEKPKNGQTKGVHFVKDYLIQNILCVETLHDVPEEE